MLVGVMLSLFGMRVSAQEIDMPQPSDSVADVQPSSTDSHFAWYAQAELDANYLWRGLYCGGLSFQAEAEVSYYGFYLNTWLNVGTTNWWTDRNAAGKPVTGLNPEIDLAIGYRWRGLMVQFIHMYFFDRYSDGRMSRYFDFQNHGPGEGGVSTEWRVAYRISDKVPLRLMWCTRTFGRDGYYQGGELKRAYSTYIEARYDQPLPYDITLSGVIGLTPWRSLYTGYEKKFAVVNLSVEVRKSWQVAKGCAVDIGGVFVFNPSSMKPLWNVRAGVCWN